MTGLFHVVPTIIVPKISHNMKSTPGPCVFYKPLGLCDFLSQSTSSFTPARGKSQFTHSPAPAGRFSSSWASASLKCESKLCFAPLRGVERRVNVAAAFPRTDVVPSQETPSCLSHHISHNYYICPFSSSKEHTLHKAKPK